MKNIKTKIFVKCCKLSMPYLKHVFARNPFHQASVGLLWSFGLTWWSMRTSWHWTFCTQGRLPRGCFQMQCTRGKRLFLPGWYKTNPFFIPFSLVQKALYKPLDCHCEGHTYHLFSPFNPSEMGVRMCCPYIIIIIIIWKMI